MRGKGKTEIRARVEIRAGQIKVHCERALKAAARGKSKK